MKVRRLFTSLGRKIYKRKFQRFWKEWGITIEEFVMLIVGIGVVAMPLIMRVIFALFGI